MTYSARQIICDNNSAMDVIHQAIWRSMLTAEFSILYWEKLANRYEERLKWVGVVLAVFASGAFLSLLSPLQATLLPKVIAGVSAALTIISTQLKWKETLKELSTVRGICIEIAAIYQQLWRDVESGAITTETARQRLDKIREKEIMAKKSKPNIRTDEKLRQECFKEVLRSRNLT
jgi:hypothetical protein